MPKIFDMIDTRLKVPAEVIEGAFLEANPGLARDQITVTCDAGRIEELEPNYLTAVAELLAE